MEKILAVIAHHLPENLPYLEMAIARLKVQERVLFEPRHIKDTSRYNPNRPQLQIAVLSSSPIEYELPGVRLIREAREEANVNPGDLASCTKKYNWAIKNLAQDYDRIIFCNDDICPQINAVSTMLKMPKNFISNVISNSDIGGLAQMAFPLPNKMGLHQLSPRDWEQLNSDKPIGNMAFHTPMVPMFFTMVHRDVINAVGLLDESLDHGGNDEDWCHRARAKRFRCAISLESMVVHFNHRTMMHTANVHSENRDMDICRAKIYGGNIFTKSLEEQGIWPKRPLVNTEDAEALER